jgi:hypothetical protein
VLCHTAQGRIGIGRPGWPELTGDERRLLDMVGAEQRNDHARVNALLSWFSRHEMRHELAIVVRAMAMTLSACNLQISARLPAVSVAS